LFLFPQGIFLLYRESLAAEKQKLLRENDLPALILPETGNIKFFCPLPYKARYMSTCLPLLKRKRKLSQSIPSPRGSEMGQFHENWSASVFHESIPYQALIFRRRKN